MLGKMGLILATLGPRAIFQLPKVGDMIFSVPILITALKPELIGWASILAGWLVLLLARPLLRVWGFLRIFSE